MYSRLARRDKRDPTSLRGSASTGWSRSGEAPALAVWLQLVVVRSRAGVRRGRDAIGRCRALIGRLDPATAVESSPRGLRSVRAYPRPRTAVSPISVSLFPFRRSLSLFSSPATRSGIYPFLASRFPNPTYSVSRSLVRKQSLSGVERLREREIPRTRYEFTFLLLYSTLACPPFCLLEPLVYLADLRLPYVSAARLISLVPLFLSLALSARVRAWSFRPTSSFALLFLPFSPLPLLLGRHRRHRHRRSRFARRC